MVIGLKFDFSGVEKQIIEAEKQIRLTHIAIVKSLVNDNEFITIFSEEIIKYIKSRQGNYTPLSFDYAQRKGSTEVFFKTETETMVKDLANGQAFSIVYSESLNQIIVALINKIAIFHNAGAGNLPPRRIVPQGNTFRNRIAKIAARKFINGFKQTFRLNG